MPDDVSTLHIWPYPDGVRRFRPRSLVLFFLAVSGLTLFTSVSGGQALVAVSASALIFKMGLATLGSLSLPVPEPPPPGELRKVKLEFRCSLCGTELRVTSANDEMPEPPRHCMEDMDFVAPVEW